jgi:hypothetical protein
VHLHQTTDLTLLDHSGQLVKKRTGGSRIQTDDLQCIFFVEVLVKIGADNRYTVGSQQNIGILQNGAVEGTNCNCTGRWRSWDWRDPRSGVLAQIPTNAPKGSHRHDHGAGRSKVHYPGRGATASKR